MENHISGRENLKGNPIMNENRTEKAIEFAQNNYFWCRSITSKNFIKVHLDNASMTFDKSVDELINYLPNDVNEMMHEKNISLEDVRSVLTNQLWEAAAEGNDMPIVF